MREGPRLEAAGVKCTVAPDGGREIAVVGTEERDRKSESQYNSKRPKKGDAWMTNLTFYSARINGVVDYVDKHLDEQLDFQRLSSMAYVSPWHFHRLFQALTGETLAERVRRRRLESAAVRLLRSPPLTAIQVALEVGFGSAEVFCRGFKSHFGLTPTQWRQGGFRNWVNERRSELDAVHRHHYHWAVVEDMFQDDEQVRRGLHRVAANPTTVVEVKPLPKMRVAYLRHVGPYGDPAITRLWERFIAWCGSRPLFHRGRAIVGVCHDSPDITLAIQCRYDTCIEVDESFRAQGEIGVQDIRGGLYACTSFKGTTAEFYPAWLRMFAEWLPQSAYQLDDRPAVEMYGDPTLVAPQHGGAVCELCLPVHAL